MTSEVIEDDAPGPQGGCMTTTAPPGPRPATPTRSPAPAPAAPPPDGAPRLPGGGLVVLLAALFVLTLDFFIVNVAVPDMRADLGASTGAITLWVAGFAIAFGAFIVLGARLGDRLGRRRLFVWGLGVFTLASAACGVAPDPTTLAVGRIAQGLGAALVSPQVLATVTATTDGEARVRALTAYGVTAGLAAVGGQLAGGALIAADVLGLGWRACFLVNVPIGLVAMALAGRWIPETRADRRHAIDGPSVVLLAVGLAALILPLAEGQDRGWPLWCVLALVAAVDLLAAFAWRQRRLVVRGADPLVDLRLFRDRTFGLGSLLCFVLQCGVASSFFVLALTLQGGIGLSALDSGLVFTTLAVGYVATSFAAPALSARFGTGLLVGGAAVSAAGEVLLALTAPGIGPGSSVAPLIPGLVLAGLGMGMLFGPSVTVALSAIDPRRSGECSGVVTTIQQTGGAVGVGLLGIVFAAVLDGDDHARAFAVASWCLVGQCVLVGIIALGLRARKA